MTYGKQRLYFCSLISAIKGMNYWKPDNLLGPYISGLVTIRGTILTFNCGTRSTWLLIEVLSCAIEVKILNMIAKVVTDEWQRCWSHWNGYWLAETGAFDMEVCPWVSTRMDFCRYKHFALCIGNVLYVFYKIKMWTLG